MRSIIARKVSPKVPLRTALSFQRGGINAVFFIASFYFIFIPSLYAAAQQEECQLPFTLVGTITGTQPLALLKLSDKKLYFYTLADKIKNFTLVSIQHNKIELSSNHQLYTLHLQQRTAIKVEAPLKQSTDLPIDIHIKRQLLNHIRHHIQQWLNAISLKLVMTDGRVSGYVVESVQNIPLNSAIGLRQGDIIKSINGVYVSQPKLFAKITNNLINNNDIYLKIERGHKLNTLHFSITD